MKLKIEWLSGMSKDWEICNPRTIFTERSEKSWPSDVHLTPSQIYGVIPQAEYMEVTGNKVVLNLTGADNMKHVEPNDFIIHLRSFQGGIEHSRYQGKVSNAYCVLIPNAKIEPRFFRWVLKSSGFIQELSSTTDQMRDGQSIKYEQFVSIGLPLPSLEEQICLADYLDSRIATIDDVVELKKQQIASFKDFKTSLITSVVTGIYDEKIQEAK